MILGSRVVGSAARWAGRRVLLSGTRLICRIQVCPFVPREHVTPTICSIRFPSAFSGIRARSYCARRTEALLNLVCGHDFCASETSLVGETRVLPHERGAVIMRVERPCTRA